MYLEVEENPNCEGTPLQVFGELTPAKPVRQMWCDINGKRTLCRVTGLEKGALPVPAYAQKVQDSGSGISILIYGGAWGLRFKPIEYEAEPWDLQNPHQWGEPYKFYGTEKDLIY